MEWKYNGNFNELAGMINYCLTMKYLIGENRMSEVNNPDSMKRAADEIGLTAEKIANAMFDAGKQMKEQLEFEKNIKEYTEIATELFGSKSKDT